MKMWKILNCRDNFLNATDKFSARFKIGLDILSTGASGTPNLVEFIIEGFLQMLPLAPVRHVMFSRGALHNGAYSASHPSAG